MFICWFGELMGAKECNVMKKGSDKCLQSGDYKVCECNTKDIMMAFGIANRGQ